MKHLLIFGLLFHMFFISAFAVTYKINSKGQITSSNSLVKQNKSPDILNNYYGQTYVNDNKASEYNISSIDIVMDYSSSMLHWIRVAEQYMSQIVAQLPNDTKIGLRVFGHDNGNNPSNPVVGMAKEIVSAKNGKYKVKTNVASYLGNTSHYCSANESLVPVTVKNTNNRINAMSNTRIGGSTPLTFALYQAVNHDFANFPKNIIKKIIIITDGDETCNGDPCAFVNELVKTRNDIIIDVVLVSEYSTSLKCLTSATGGSLYNPTDPQSFIKSLQKSITSSPSNKPIYKENEQQFEFIKD